jgi:hypothetical protein
MYLRYRCEKLNQFGYCWDNPQVAIGVAAVTAATIGTIVATLPSSCTASVVNVVTYEACGNTWFKPVYSGNQLGYVAVAKPQ